MDAVVVYPRLLRRVRAALIDSVCAIFVLYSWWIFLPLLADYHLAIKLAYPVAAWFILDPVLVWRIGATPGHYLMKLRVQSSGSGRNIGLARAAFRALLKAITGWWSFIFVLMTHRHQALHDVLTGVVVVLREPKSLPKREQISERLQDRDNYRYPSAIRKICVILVYFFLSLVALGLLAWLLQSQECFDSRHCSSLDILTSYSLNIAWFFAVATILAYGWRARIYGARRRPRSSPQ